MLKQAFCILFSFLYLTSSAGINLNIHYCGGKVKNISFLHTNEADCCGVGMEKKKNCCKEKAVSYQFKADQNKAEFSVLKTSVKKIISVLIFGTNTKTTFFPVATVTYAWHDPPDPNSSGKYILHRVFRI